MERSKNKGGLLGRAVRRALPFSGSIGRRLIRAGLRLLHPESRAPFCLGQLAGTPDGQLAKHLARRLKKLPLKQVLGLRAKLDQTGRMDYAPRDVFLHLTSDFERLRLRSVSKEPWTVEWIEEAIRPGDVFYDIGANVGAYALIAAKWTYGQARVFAFEPGFANFTSLCRNVVLNGCQDCIVPLPVALSDRTGMTNFKYRDIQAGAALHAMGDREPGLPGFEYEVTYEQPMLAYNLEDLIVQFGLPLPNHIKLDVDGSELDVLRGAGRVLADPAVKTVMMEIEDATESSLVEQLEDSGLKLARRFRREGDAQGKPVFHSYGTFARAGVLGNRVSVSVPAHAA